MKSICIWIKRDFLPSDNEKNNLDTAEPPHMLHAIRGFCSLVFIHIEREGIMTYLRSAQRLW